MNVCLSWTVLFHFKQLVFGQEQLDLELVRLQQTVGERHIEISNGFNMHRFSDKQLVVAFRWIHFIIIFVRYLIACIYGPHIKINASKMHRNSYFLIHTIKTKKNHTVLSQGVCNRKMFVYWCLCRWRVLCMI